MNKFLFLIVVMIANMMYADLNVHVDIDQLDDRVVLYVVNNEYCPVSLNIELKAKNILLPKSKEIDFVAAAHHQKQIIATFKVKNKNKGYRFSYNYYLARGNVNLAIENKDYVYTLPFNGYHTIEQGYNGSSTHKNTNALDFDMDVGTEIFSVSDGVVVELEEKHNKACFSKRCEKYTNSVVIYHVDGTFAAYVHLKHQGVVVNVGQKVKQGQLIAYSGNTGYSSGPHLHFEVYKPTFKKDITIKTKFKVAKNKPPLYLKEGVNYYH